MKKPLKIAAAVLASLCFAAYLIFEMSKQPINSDGACMLLEAQDILSGNVLLSDWHLTGVSFLTTDLPWFVLAVSLFGVTLRAYYFACISMYLFMVICAVPLVFYKVRDRLWAMLSLFGIGLIPTTYALSHSFVHTAVFALSFLALCFAARYADSPSRKNLTVFCVLTALAVCGDRLGFVLIVLPLVIISVIGGVQKRLGIAAIISAAGGYAFEKLYCAIGGADWNSFYTTYFSEISEIPHNIGLYFEYILRLINSYFFGKELFSAKTAVFGLKIIICAAAAFFAVRELHKMVKGKKFDLISAAFAIGFAVMTALLWLTGYTTDITTGRYIAYLPLALAVSAARNFEPKGKVRLASLALCAALFASSLIPHGSAYSAENSFSRLAAFLESENLTEGYSAFWDSSVLSAYSGGKLAVRAVKFEDGRLSPRVWFCKNSWYDEPKNFVIVRNSPSPDEDNYRYNGIFTSRTGYGFDYGITQENIKSCLGEPNEIKNFENYSIFIYEEIPLYKEELWKN